MTILFDATRPAKSTRPFGTGLIRSLPTYWADHTAEDAAWLVADNARAARAALDAELDDMAAEAEAVARLEMGLLF
jgi:hypothetical protein